MYRVHEFAELTGVTVKALHHYDRLGLLKPRRTRAGYRTYAEQDLTRLEQIVALKFLGLPLKQIKALLDRDTLQLPAALRMQRTVLEEKRLLLDRAIGAISRAEDILQSGKAPGAAVLKEIIEAIGMQTNTETNIEFMKNYYREEAWVSFKARHRDWPSRDWNELFREIESCLWEEPGSAKAQALAARWRALRVSDSGGDARVHGGLIRAWADRQYWPEAVQKQFAEFQLDEISRFIARAFGYYRKKHYGDVEYEEELATFSSQERERLPLAMADLSFKVGRSLDADPAGKLAQSLAARWMELLESRTGGHPDFKSSGGSYESYLKWMDSWPPAIYQKLTALDQQKMHEFILKAVAIPMHS